MEQGIKELMTFDLAVDEKRKQYAAYYNEWVSYTTGSTLKFVE